MRDQAEKLRIMVQRKKMNTQTEAKTIAVVSGKGGVGKSNISINTAYILKKKGFKVLLFDLDIGMGNVNLILGTPSPNTLADYLQTNISIHEIIYKTKEGLFYISAGNGLNKTIELNENLLQRLLDGMEKLLFDFDYIIFDMAAGANTYTLKLLLAVDEIFVVSTPEPTAMTDAYSMMKYITLQDSPGTIYIICNRAENKKQGLETLERLKLTAKKFLNRDVITLGILPEDPHVRKAVIQQTAFTVHYPRSSISQSMEKLIDLYLTGNPNNEKQFKSRTFVKKLRQFFQLI